MRKEGRKKKGEREGKKGCCDKLLIRLIFRAIESFMNVTLRAFLTNR